MCFTRRASLVLCAGLLAASAATADDLTTLLGKKVSGKLVAVDREGVTFAAGSVETKFPAKDVLVVDLGNKVVAPAKDAKNYHEVELTDGSLLRCSKYTVKGKKVELELLAGPEGVEPPVFELPLSSVSFVCRNADDAKHRDDWKKMIQNRGKRDLYVMRQAGGLNFVQGTVVEGNPDGTMLVFQKEDGSREDLRQSRATGGLVFNQPQAASEAPTLCKVVDVFGNTLVAQAIALTDAGVKVTTVSGAGAAYPSSTGVAVLDYAQGNIAYLSDLQPQVDAPAPAEVEEKAFAQLKGATQPAAYLRDRLPGEAALTLDGVAYQKGVCVAVDTVLTYQLGGDYREFKAVAGFADSRHANAAELRVTVEADGRVLAAEVVSGKDKPKGMSFDVKGVKVLRVLVERDYPSDVSSYVVLAEARVQK